MDDETRAAFIELTKEVRLVRTDLMARMDRLQGAATRDREDIALASEAGHTAHKSALQLLGMTTTLHRRISEAERAIEELRDPKN